MAEVIERVKVMTPERVWTLSNILSILRGAMGFPIAVLLSKDRTGWATVLIVLAILSDAIDGFLARRNNQVTNLGKALDPIADKVCILTVVFFLIIKEQIPLQFFVIVAIRDLIISMMYVYLMNVKDVAIGAIFTGKISVAAVTAVTISYVYHLEQWQGPLTLFAYVIMGISFVQYTLFFLRNFGRRGAGRAGT
ncbi:MAG: CDP-alcohol phosphatidyltransferase family protein [Deltaproteobacteria bacterium]|nr:CDP-alcohol phosphatidyltransferase family protein [Deltaproteobacteria bacterium]